MKNKKIGELPRALLLLLAQELGHRSPKSATDVELTDFISRSI